MSRFSITLFILLALVCGAARSQIRSNPTDQSKIRMPLAPGWQFRQAGQDKWYPASVPGCVHTDLLNNKLIDDPFYRDNDKSLQWIGKPHLEHRTTFNLTAELLKHTNVELVFEGLDTYTDVCLNDERLIGTDNMFR